MRIVYDDKNLPKFEEAFNELLFQIECMAPQEFANNFADSSWISMDSLINDINKDKVMTYFAPILANFGLTIRKNSVFHAHGIGNNNRYEVAYFDSACGEYQIVGHLHLNHSLYCGILIVYLTDLDGRKISYTYELRKPQALSGRFAKFLSVSVKN